jgi:hypothetical protein
MNFVSLRRLLSSASCALLVPMVACATPSTNVESDEQDLTGDLVSLWRRYSLRVTESDINYGQTVIATRPADRRQPVQLYPFSGAAGDEVHLRVRTLEGRNAFVGLFDGAGRLMVSNRAESTAEVAEVVAVLPEDGRYSVAAGADGAPYPEARRLEVHLEGVAGVPQPNDGEARCVGAHDWQRGLPDGPLSVDVSIRLENYEYLLPPNTPRRQGFATDDMSCTISGPDKDHLTIECGGGPGPIFTQSGRATIAPNGHFTVEQFGRSDFSRSQIAGHLRPDRMLVITTFQASDRSARTEYLFDPQGPICAGARF